MTNRKTTKRALISSVLALVLCFAMLLGSTYAWFTDTATTNVNTIKSGILDVKLISGDGQADLEGQTIQFKNVDDSEDLLWEPGATFYTDTFKIKNEGNLALDYTIVISAVQGEVSLMDVIEFVCVKVDGSTKTELTTFPNEEQLLPGGVSAEYTIKATMSKEAGNEYQNMTLEGIAITVYATQSAYEKDATGSTYDEDTKPEVRTAVYTVTADTTINAIIDVDSIKGATDAITVTAGTATITGGFYDAGQTPFGGDGNTAVWANGGNVVITDGTFYSSGLAAGDTGHIDLIYCGLGTITIEGGFYYAENNTVWLLNCKDANYANGTAKIIVKGGTFVNFNPADVHGEPTNPTSYVAEGYTVTESEHGSDTWYTVVVDATYEAPANP